MIVERQKDAEEALALPGARARDTRRRRLHRSPRRRRSRSRARLARVLAPEPEPELSGALAHLKPDEPVVEDITDEAEADGPKNTTR